MLNKETTGDESGAANQPGDFVTRSLLHFRCFVALRNRALSEGHVQRDGTSKPAVMATSSSATAATSAATGPSKKKALPHSFSELLDVALYSFCCQAGVRAQHKMRGDPVLEGVAAMLGRLISTSNPEVESSFNEMTSTRLGNF